VGGQVRLQDGFWPVVGVFSTGSFIEGDMFADSETLMAALRRASFRADRPRATQHCWETRQSEKRNVSFRRA